MNDLNYDDVNHFNDGVTSFQIRLTVTGPTAFVLFDPTGINLETTPIFAGQITRIPSLVQQEGSSCGLAPLANTLYSRNIRVTRTLYSIEPQDSNGVDVPVPLQSLQINSAGLTFQRVSIDGQIHKDQDIQPNFTRRNWHFAVPDSEDGFLVQFDAEYIIDQQMGMFVEMLDPTAYGLSDMTVNFTFEMNGFC